MRSCRALDRSAERDRRLHGRADLGPDPDRANERRSGKVTRRRRGSTPFRLAACRATETARARYSDLLRCRGFPRPSGRRSGVNSLGKSSRRERAPRAPPGRPPLSPRRARRRAPDQGQEPRRTGSRTPPRSSSAAPARARREATGPGRPGREPGGPPAWPRRHPPRPCQSPPRGDQPQRARRDPRGESPLAQLDHGQGCERPSSCKSARIRPDRNASVSSSRAIPQRRGGRWTIETSDHLVERGAELPERFLAGRKPQPAEPSPRRRSSEALAAEGELQPAGARRGERGGPATALGAELSQKHFPLAPGERDSTAAATARPPFALPELGG